MFTKAISAAVLTGALAFGSASVAFAGNGTGDMSGSGSMKSGNMKKSDTMKPGAMKSGAMKPNSGSMGSDGMAQGAGGRGNR